MPTIVISFVALAVVCLILGALIYRFVERNSMTNIGTIRVETSDPDGPYMFLELETSVETIEKLDKAKVNIRVTNIDA